MKTIAPVLWTVALLLVSACHPDASLPQAKVQDPSFTLPALDEELISLEDYRGQVVVIHFGASWCPFCRAEDPHLEALYQTYKERGVQVLVINVGESNTAAARWKQEAAFSFPMLLDRDGTVAARFAPPQAQPDLPRHEVMVASNLIVDQAGNVRFISLLDTRTFDAQLIELQACLDKVLAES
ncbi:MAG TPA: TlpA disulfide reductase family protein [Rhodothermales bacterium]|nr:TlpA disulfide reductase family protein [Rhodothermales bacterium]